MLVRCRCQIYRNPIEIPLDPDEEQLYQIRESYNLFLPNLFYKKMAKMSEALVYHGPWINFSKGTILGATLTISARDGAILVAFLALFVRFVGGHFWSILCFVLHQSRSSKEPAVSRSFHISLLYFNASRLLPYFHCLIAH